MTPTHDLAIAGGGCTGTSAVIALSRQPALHARTLHLIDPDGFGHGGVAYGKSGQGLLNEVAGGLSPWDPPAFADWCGAHGFGGDPQAFHDRAVFRPFQAEELARARDTLARRGVTIVDHYAKAIAVHLTADNAAAIETDDGRWIVADRDGVLLATGYGRSRQFASLEGAPGFIGSPYPPADWTRLPAVTKPGARLLVIGTGPALYDVLRCLRADFAGTVTAVSPTGLAPGRRNIAVEGQEARLDLPALFAGASNAATLSCAVATALDTAETHGSSIRRTALDIQKMLPALLGPLPAAERASFARGILSRLFHACTPVPEIAWRQREAWERDGRLCLRAARLSASDIRPGADGFTVRLDGEAATFDAVINCAGHDALNNPLIERLVADGLAHRDEGLPRLATHADGFRLAGSGLACIGPPTAIGLHGVEAFYEPVRQWAASCAL